MNQKPMDQDPPKSKDWRELCEAAATELDPVKLLALVREINRALAERENKPNSRASNFDINDGSLRFKYAAEI